MNERYYPDKPDSIQHPTSESYSILRSHHGGLTSVVIVAYHSLRL